MMLWGDTLANGDFSGRTARIVLGSPEAKTIVLDAINRYLDVLPEPDCTIVGAAVARDLTDPNVIWYYEWAKGVPDSAAFSTRRIEFLNTILEHGTGCGDMWNVGPIRYVGMFAESNTVGTVPREVVDAPPVEPYPEPVPVARAGAAHVYADAPNSRVAWFPPGDCDTTRELGEMMRRDGYRIVSVVVTDGVSEMRAERVGR